MDCAKVAYTLSLINLALLGMAMLLSNGVGDGLVNMIFGMFGLGLMVVGLVGLLKSFLEAQLEAQ